MPVYDYTGLTADGKQADGFLDADSAKGARLALKKTGIFPIDVVEQAQPHPTGLAALVGRRTASFSTLELALLTRRFATLLQAGLPLVEALELLRDQAETEGVKALLTTIVDQVRGGRALSQVLETYPDTFPPVYVNVIRAGEMSGALADMLTRLADSLDSQDRLRQKVLGAMLYPLVMVCVGVAVIAILMTVVIPRIAVVFADLKQTLPLPTRVLIAASGFLAAHWPWLLGAGGLAAWGLARGLRTPAWRARLDALALKLPVVRHVVTLSAMSRLADTLATLLSSGVPLLRSLDVGKRVMNNATLESAIETAKLQIKEGQSIAEPLRRSGVIPTLMVHMIAVGEKSGELEGMLRHCAKIYEGELDRLLARLVTLLEPLVVVAMGVVVFFIMLAVLLPLFEMSQMVR